MKRGKIVLMHIGIFIVLSILLVLFAESILIVVAPGFHHVEMWIALIIYGILGIFLTLLISCIVFLMKKKKQVQ
ncbi:hypothetical protein DKG77_03645 [Flagellimonas aquimarina]|uniref:Uncharacterized protein n=1 Tax=Flagellimonas aquimarina TaxID=2201895 RepID=A0A316L6L9_9FLAO|nr:hypothetical protein DKG77_03645 [Allomuricauda koreensis]